MLVVDDSIVNQEVAKDFLLEFECDVSVASNGVEAVEMSAGECFDLILMDCQMPLMDGFAATQAIRERAKSATTSGVPIVALTANAFESDRQKCLECGMDDFLKKPFLPTEIEQIIEKWLGAEPERPSQPAPKPETIGQEAKASEASFALESSHDRV